MPPSSFASAAAGTPSAQNPTRDAASEWSRRTNGATQTFRRPSGAASATTPTAVPHPEQPHASQSARYVPPHRNGHLPETHTRYTKEQLVEIYRIQAASEGGLSEGLPSLFLAGWQPDMANGNSATWGRSDYTRDTHPGPDICWDNGPSVDPLALTEMDDDEREVFLSSVNTPMKPPTTAKENQQANGLPGRKTSISNSANTPGGFGLPSPSVARGGGRRRDTSESYPFPQNNLASPGAFSRDDQRAASPPPSLQRRRTDHKELSRPEDKEIGEKSTGPPFGSLKRNPTGPLSAGFNAPASPWGTGPQSAGLAPMGSFGSYGMSGNGQAATSNDKRGGAGGGRPESRFKNLLNKDSSEDIGQRALERKTSISSLSRVHENESWRPQDRMDPGNDPLDEAEENIPSGSAALGSGPDISPQHARQGYRGFGTPSRQGTQDDFGFGAFGMTSDGNHGFGQGILPGREAFQQTPAQYRLGQPGNGNEPMSPTDTNPYQSPEQHGADRMTGDNGDESRDMLNARLPGLGQFGGDPSHQMGGLGSLNALPNLGRAPGVQGSASDRSQTSSVGPNRGFGGLGGLGQLGNVPGSAAWPASQGGLGTPGRQTAGLNNPFGGVFSNSMDLQSPGLAGLGASIMTPQGTGYGGSRLTSMFPQAMQDQMRQGEGDRDASSERQHQAFSSLGDFGRAGESPFANQALNQGHQQDLGDSQQAQLGALGQQQMQQLGQSQDTQSQAQNPPPGSSASNQPPAPQQRTMVMPDRMRWIYRDPQGQTQGPWTGLEMHDWYKAGFFSPELLVKKYEDPDYEPLAQLIRRIGNSREPFLVPQIGIPHGSVATTGPAPWAGPGTLSAAAGAAQPPFASSFPSFGTTLTAEQQNALERRKQEEQYLMARQKEHLAQAQIAQRMQLQGGHSNLAPGQLQHHSSAHSLHSQPSFGSITSPTGYQPSPVQGPTAGIPQPTAQGFFDNSFRAPQSAGGLGAVGTGADSLGRIREEDIPGILDRLNLSSSNRAGTGQFGAPGQGYGGQQQHEQDLHEKQVQQMFQDRARLQQEQAEHDALQQANEQQQMSNERLQQFHELQLQNHEGHHLSEAERSVHQTAQSSVHDTSADESSIDSPDIHVHEQQQQQHRSRGPLSLTEQVQKAASAQQSPAPQQTGFPQPFPPAPSQSPLPAPAAQRTTRQSVADQLQTESRDESLTPSVETPGAAMAPWAKEPAEAPRGPSLKEIQEAEAKKAAEAEGLAAAARRAAFQKEMEVQQAQVVVAQPGLPTTSTWGAGSPATPTGSTPAVWAKTAQKPSGAPSSKTLAQIQKEEEARKRRVAVAAAAAQHQANVISGTAVPAGVKSYANLASKVASPLPNINTNSAWTTVGAGGKPKTPAVASPAPGRSTSSGAVPVLQPPTVTRKAPAVRSTTLGTPGAINPQDEFKKWAVGELRPDLNKGINVEEFVSGLVEIGAQADIITEAVHGASSTIDSRHFAEEFLRRKRLADKGLLDSSIPKTASPSHAADKAGGWSQVAKKGPTKEEPKEEANGNFRMVPSKKRGGKR